ncbi:MAG: TIGR01777 family oxidoreductase [Actinomycetota bacterium]|nr:TIGR01777 family oxidoreductase [Actinomycetota bacterium]
MKTVAIAGSSGTIGRALERLLIQEGFSVKRLVRRNQIDDSEIFWDPKNKFLDPNRLVGINAIVNLAGVGIGDKRWSRKRMEQIISSRVEGTELICKTIAGIKSDERPSVLINASAIGYYGHTGSNPATENSPLGEGFLADVCSKWEESTLEAERAGIRVVHARTGIVLSASGGLLKRLLPIFKLGLGGCIGSGEQLMSWISLRDEIAAIKWMLDNEINGPVNLVSPEPLSNFEFSKTLGDVLRRPVVFKIPSSVLSLVYGRQLVDELMISSQSIVPEVLLKNNFTFSDPVLKKALENEIRSGS